MSQTTKKDSDMHFLLPSLIEQLKVTSKAINILSFNVSLKKYYNLKKHFNSQYIDTKSNACKEKQIIVRVMVNHNQDTQTLIQKGQCSIIFCVISQILLQERLHLKEADMIISSVFLGIYNGCPFAEIFHTPANHSDLERRQV